MSLGIIKNNYDYLIEREERNMDLDDEELQATREMNKTAWESEIDKWSKEYLIERYKDLVEIEKEHKKENGELREEVIHWKGKYHLENRRYLDLYDKKINVPIINATEEMLQQYVEKSKVREKIEEIEKEEIWIDEDYYYNEELGEEYPICKKEFTKEELEEVVIDILKELQEGDK